MAEEQLDDETQESQDEPEISGEGTAEEAQAETGDLPGGEGASMLKSAAVGAAAGAAVGAAAGAARNVIGGGGDEGGGGDNTEPDEDEAGDGEQE